MGKKKLTFEFVKDSFEKEDYKLLLVEYINNKQRLEYICPKNHKHAMSWCAWVKGNRCPYCSGKIKKTIEFIRDEFKKEKYVLLTEKYKNSSQKLSYICPEGHKHSISWDNWNQGHRCPYCDGQGKPCISVIREFFESKGYELLSNSYVNDSGKLLYKCPVGHIHSMRWNNFKHGKKCPSCAITNRALQISGDRHYGWLGGITCEPYCDAWADKEFKESIKERDNYQCQNPDCWGTSKRLTIHHIDYIKKNCQPKNLITLCNSCNGRANRNREWHKNFYNKIMGMKNNSINSKVASCKE